MNIAQLAPLIEPVPPVLYGGTERIVSFLTEELVRRGHRVTLFASGDSHTTADLYSVRDRSVRLDPENPDAVAFHMIELVRAFDMAGEFDIIHSHVDYLAFPFARFSRVPSVHTLHGRLDLPHWGPMVEYFRDIPLVSISNDQRRPLSHIAPRWMATVYHGLPEDSFRPGRGEGGYLTFFSRLSRDKRPDLAVEVAKRAGLPLKIAGKVDTTDREYFEQEIEPLLDHPLIEYLGEIHDSEKPELLGNAAALIFPIDWPEPFGLVMTEAMACGTPVIARPCGSVPEVVREGVTGFIADTVEEMVEAVKQIDRIDRSRCLMEARQRFSVEAMADGYEAVYRKILTESPV